MNSNASAKPRAADLGRNLGVGTATALVVANMVGSGIFVTSGFMAERLPGSGWVILCWMLGGLVAISGALCYAELATRMPEAGGEYVYLKRLYHPALGFLTGWTSFFVGFSAPIALSALGFSEYLFTAILQQLPRIHPEVVFLAKKGVAAAIVIVFTTLHFLGQRLGAGVQNFLTVIKILTIFGLALVGLGLGGGSWSYISFSLGGSVGGTAFGAAMMMVMFSYSGWNASAYIAGELRRPSRTLPISLVAGTSIVIALYIAINLFIFHAAPYAELQGKVAVAEVAAVWSFGNWLADLLGAMVGVAMLSSLGAFIMLGPRIYYAMARDGLFFSSAAEVHPRFGVPGKALILQGVIALIMVFVGAIDQLLVYVGFALNIFPWLAIAGIFIARRRKIGEETAVRIRAFPLAPLFYLASTLVMMAFALVNRPLESCVAVATVLMGLPCFFLWRRAFPGSIRMSAQLRQSE